eukprot:448281_1
MNPSKSSKYKQNIVSLLSGYFRDIQNQLDIKIPSIISHIIKQFYPCYLIYAIGDNGFGQFGTDDSKVLANFTFLPQFSYLLSNIHDIYTNNERIYFRSILNNDIYGAGKDTHGQLFGSTQSDTTNDYAFCRLINSKLKTEKIQFVSKGQSNDHTFFVTVNNNIYACGTNKLNQCGISNSCNELHLMSYKCGLLNEIIINIECGQSHTVFLCKNGKIWTCGDNRFGQCGLNSSIEIQLIPRIINMKNDCFITQICCGLGHTLCIDNMGGLYGFGDNAQFQLGLNQTDIDENNLDIDEFWKVRCLQCIPYFREGNIRMLSIGCGIQHSIGVDDKGICYLFGANDHKQLGVVQFEIDDDYIFEPLIFQKMYSKYQDVIVKDVKCGWVHSLLFLDMRNELNVVAFGNNYYKQCSVLKCKDTYIEEPHVLDRQSEIMLGKNEEIVSIAAQSYNTMIITQVNVHAN